MTQTTSPVDTPPAKKQVRFAQQNLVHEVPRSDSDVFPHLHWSREDLKEILDRSRELALSLSRRMGSSCTGDEQSCSDDLAESVRGLELLMPAVTQQRIVVKMQARRAVLLTQKVQRELGVSDPDLMAQVISQVTCQSMKTARAVGLSDERAASLPEEETSDMNGNETSDNQSNVSDTSSATSNFEKRIRERHRRSKERRMRKLVSEAA